MACRSVARTWIRFDFAVRVRPTLRPVRTTAETTNDSELIKAPRAPNDRDEDAAHEIAEHLRRLVDDGCKCKCVGVLVRRHGLGQERGSCRGERRRRQRGDEREHEDHADRHRDEHRCERRSADRRRTPIISCLRGKRSPNVASTWPMPTHGNTLTVSDQAAERRRVGLFEDEDSEARRARRSRRAPESSCAVRRSVSGRLLSGARSCCRRLRRWPTSPAVTVDGRLLHSE